MKDSLALDDHVRREHSHFVEKLANFIFKIHNLGVKDIKKQVRLIVQALYEHRKVYETLGEVEARQWILKVY